MPLFIVIVEHIWQQIATKALHSIYHMFIMTRHVKQRAFILLYPFLNLQQ